VDEDQRAAALWTAPFLLAVHDDSPDQRLEYANAAACRLLGAEFEDAYGTPSHALVAPSPAAQSEWAFALRDADERAARCAGRGGGVLGEPC
jgi:PAS domain-containing protein